MQFGRFVYRTTGAIFCELLFFFTDVFANWVKFGKLNRPNLLLAHGQPDNMKPLPDDEDTKM